MTRWSKGSEVIERLLNARHLEHVPADADADTVAALIATARRHVTSAFATAADDPEGALALAYDAARKTATALLAHQGLRPTSAGGHIAVVEAMNAQFPGVSASSRSTAFADGATRPSTPTPSTTTRSPPTRSTTQSNQPRRASPQPRS